MTTEWAEKIPRVLMENFVLCIRGEDYTFAELELYYFSENHQDPYVHKRKLQTEKHAWYFHKKNDEGKYNGGTFKGLDMTFGKILENKEYFLGVLIRSVQKNGELIEGPCNCVNKILEICECDSIEKLSEKLNKKIFKKNDFMYVKRSQNTEKNVYTSTRVGLSDIDPIFKEKLYRYVFLPNKFRKNKKEIANSLMKQGEKHIKICELI